MNDNKNNVDEVINKIKSILGGDVKIVAVPVGSVKDSVTGKLKDKIESVLGDICDCEDCVAKRKLKGSSKQEQDMRSQLLDIIKNSQMALKDFKEINEYLNKENKDKQSLLEFATSLLSLVHIPVRYYRFLTPAELNDYFNIVIKINDILNDCVNSIFTEINDSKHLADWKEDAKSDGKKGYVNPKSIKYHHPGVYLEEELEARGVTVEQFAKDIDYSYDKLNQVIKGYRFMSNELIALIAKKLKTSPEYWGNIQSYYIEQHD